MNRGVIAGDGRIFDEGYRISYLVIILHDHDPQSTHHLSEPRLHLLLVTYILLVPYITGIKSFCISAIIMNIEIVRRKYR